MLEQLNRNIFSTLNHFAGSSYFLDMIGVAAANYMPIAFLVILIYLWFKKNESKDIVLYSLYAAIIGLGVNLVITHIYFHPRPFMIPLGTVLIPHANETSFPSDHTTLMLSLALILTYFKKTRVIGVVLIFLGLTGGLARIFCGLHFPFDIAGSVFVSAIASSSVFFGQKLFSRINSFFINIYYSIGRNLQKNKK